MPSCRATSPAATSASAGDAAEEAWLNRHRTDSEQFLRLGHERCERRQIHDETHERLARLEQPAEPLHSAPHRRTRHRHLDHGLDLDH